MPEDAALERAREICNTLSNYYGGKLRVPAKAMDDLHVSVAAEIARLRELLNRSYVHIEGDNWAVPDHDGCWALRKRLAFPFSVSISERFSTLDELLAAVESVKK